MSFDQSSNRPAPQRAFSYPPATHETSIGSMAFKMEAESLPVKSQEHPQIFSFDGEDGDLEDHPEQHFLSPMHEYEYEDWADDSDDDGEEIEMDAGIMDFALFDSDRRRAEQAHEELPSRWEGLMSSQESALRRAEQRTRGQPVPDTTRPPLPMDIPGLTPDTSPELRDNLEYQDDSPPYLTVTVTPPQGDESSIGSDEELPLFLRQSSTAPQRRRKLQRPGLKHSRTLSGKAHVWRRPSWEIYPVGEDAAAEERAEYEESIGGDDRGRH